MAGLIWSPLRKEYPYYTLHPYQWSHLFLAKILFAGQSCKYWLYRKRRNSADGGQAKQHLQAEPDFGLKCLILRTLGLLHSMKGLLHSMNVGYSVYTGKFESKRSLMFILMATILVSTLILHTNDFHSKSAFLSSICKSSRGASRATGHGVPKSQAWLSNWVHTQQHS